MPRKVIFSDKVKRTSVRNIDDALQKLPTQRTLCPEYAAGPKGILKPPSTFTLPQNVSDWRTTDMQRSKRKKKTHASARKNRKFQVVHHFRLSEQLDILAKFDQLNKCDPSELLDRLDLGKLPRSLRRKRWWDILPAIDRKMKTCKSTTATNRGTSLSAKEEKPNHERGAELIKNTSIKDTKKLCFPDIVGKLQIGKDAVYMKKSHLDSGKISFQYLDDTFEKERYPDLVKTKPFRKDRRVPYQDIDGEIKKEMVATAEERSPDTRTLSFPAIDRKHEKRRIAKVMEKTDVGEAITISSPDMDSLWDLQKERNTKLMKKKYFLDARKMSLPVIGGQFEKENDSETVKTPSLKHTKKVVFPDIGEKLENDSNVKLGKGISSPNYKKKSSLPPLDNKSKTLKAAGPGKTISSDDRKATPHTKTTKRKKERAAERLKEALLPKISAKHKMARIPYCAITAPRRSAASITNAAGLDAAPTGPRRGQTSAGMLHAIYNDTGCYIQ